MPCPYLKKYVIKNPLSTSTLLVCATTENEHGDGTGFRVQYLPNNYYQQYCNSEENWKNCPFYILAQNIGIKPVQEQLK